MVLVYFTGCGGRKRAGSSLADTFEIALNGHENCLACSNSNFPIGFLIQQFVQLSLLVPIECEL